MARNRQRAREIIGRPTTETDKARMQQVLGPPTPPELRTFEAKTSTIYYTGPTGAKSVTYTDPESGETYTDTTKPIGPPTSGLPDDVPGIAFGYRNLPKHGRETLGGYYLVTPKAGPGAGQAFVLPHSDLGPGAGKGEKLDYNAPAAKMVFGSMKERDMQGGAYLKYIGKNLPEGVQPGRQANPDVLAEKYGLSQGHANSIKEQRNRLGPGGGGFGGGGATGGGLPPGQIPVRQFNTGDPSPKSKYRIEAAPPGGADPTSAISQKFNEGYGPGGVTLFDDGMGVDWEKSMADNPSLREVEKAQAGPDRFDRYTGKPLAPTSSGRELDSATPTVNGNGKLDVDVKAPKGVSVKAEGEGLFNKTETNRQMEPMAE